MLPSTASGVGLGPGTDVCDLGTFASAHQPSRSVRVDRRPAGPMITRAQWLRATTTVATKRHRSELKTAIKTQCDGRAGQERGDHERICYLAAW